MIRVALSLLVFATLAAECFAPLFFTGRTPRRAIEASIGQTSSISAVGATNIVTVTWAAVDGATAYDLFFDTSAGISISDTEITGVTSPHVHTGLSNGTTYYYRVRARNAGVTGGLSDLEASATPTAPGAVPGKTTSISVVAGDTTNTVTFATVATATSYKLYRSITSPVTTSDTLVTAAATSGYVNTGLTNGVEYFYRVVAVNAIGDGDISDVEASGTPTAAEENENVWKRYVDPVNGADTNSGVEAAPFRSLGQFQQALRVATGRTASGSGWNGMIDLDGNGSRETAFAGAIAILKAGFHLPSTASSSTPWSLDHRDSGIDDARRIIIRAAPGEEAIMSGGYVMDDNDWSLMTGSDPGWNQMDGAYRATIYKVKLSGSSSLGVDSGSLTGNGMMTRLVILIVDGVARDMARWPAGVETDTGPWETIIAATGGGAFDAPTTVTLDSTTPASWDVTSQDVLAQGTWSKAWSTQVERIDSMEVVGGNSVLTFTRDGSNVPSVSNASTYRTFICFRNVLQTMAKGEYVWNRARGYMYYRPLDGQILADDVGGPEVEANVVTSVTELPTVMTLGTDDNNAADACNYNTFEGIIFEGTRQHAIQVFGSTGVTFANCTVRNFGHNGWNVEDVVDFTIDGGSTKNSSLFAGYIHGGNKDTLTNANIIVRDHTIDNMGMLQHGNVTAALIFTDFSNTNSCGVLVDGLTLSNIRDAGLAIGGPNTTIRNSTFNRCGMLCGDAGAITIKGEQLYPYSFTNINVLIEGNTFTNMIKHPRHNNSTGAIFTIYAESSSYWTVQDNTFVSCDQAMNIAIGKNHIIRRNKFTDCHLGHYGLPVVFGNRLGFASNASSLPADLADKAVQNEPYLSAAPRLKDFRTGQPEHAVILYHDDIVFVDNMTTTGTKLARYASRQPSVPGSGGSSYPATVSGFAVGIPYAQLNYPVGATGTPVEGGGTVTLQSVSTVDP